MSQSSADPVTEGHPLGVLRAWAWDLLFLRLYLKSYSTGFVFAQAAHQGVGLSNPPASPSKVAVIGPCTLPSLLTCQLASALL